MSRVKPVRPEDMSPADRALYEKGSSYGTFGNLMGVMANRPPVMQHTFGLLFQLKGEGVLPARYLELALVNT